MIWSHVPSLNIGMVMTARTRTLRYTVEINIEHKYIVFYVLSRISISKVSGVEDYKMIIVFSPMLVSLLSNHIFGRRIMMSHLRQTSQVLL